MAQAEGVQAPGEELIVESFIEEARLGVLLPVSGNLADHLRHYGDELREGLEGQDVEDIGMKRIAYRGRIRKLLTTIVLGCNDNMRTERIASQVCGKIGLLSRLIFREALLSVWIRNRVRRPQEDKEERVTFFREVMEGILETQSIFEDAGLDYPRLFTERYPLDGPLPGEIGEADNEPPAPDAPRQEEPREERYFPVMRYDQLGEPFPSFDGNIRDWEPFWAQFLALVDENPRLAPILKLKKLLAALKGEAKEKARIFNFEEKSYEPLKRFLVDEYGEPERLLQHLFEKLSGWAPLTEPCSYPDFSRFNVIAQEYLRDVRRYRPDVVKVPETIIYIIRAKLPDLAARRWEEKVGLLRKEAQLEAMAMLLAEEARVRRTRHLDTSHGAGSRRRTPQNNERMPSAECFAIAAAAALDPNKCPFCGENHNPARCTKELSPTDKKRLLMRARRCLLCLAAGHMVGACTAAKCGECNKAHHLILHGAEYIPSRRRRFRDSNNQGSRQTPSNNPNPAT